MSGGPAREPDGGVGYAAESDNRHRETTVVGRLRPVLAIASQEYRLSVRNRWAYALTGLFGSLALLVAAFGGTSVGPGRIEAVIVSLASLGTYLVPLAALAFGYDIVVGADEAGWLDVVFALPVPRSAVVVGSYLGRAVTLAAATVLGFGIAGMFLVAVAGVKVGLLFLQVVLGTMALGLGFLAISTLVSALAPGKTHALGGILLVWVWFVFIHDLLALGLIAAVALPDSVLWLAVLLNPAAVFRVIVLTGVQSAGVGLAAGVATTGLSLPFLGLGMAAWIIGPVCAAGQAVKRRSV